jgi:hypothetical protein
MADTMAERVMDGADYRSLVAEAAEGLSRDVRYQGFEPPDTAGDCRIEVLVSEVPRELVLSSDLVTRARHEAPGSEEVQEPAEAPHVAPDWVAGRVRQRIREALALMIRENVTTVRVSRDGISAEPTPVAIPDVRAA